MSDMWQLKKDMAVYIY